jgi:hypothetical protein
MMVLGALDSVSYLSSANDCLVSVGVVGLNVVGLHGINISAGYTMWTYQGTLKKNGIITDQESHSQPFDDFFEKSTFKINCQFYRATTDAVIKGPGKTPFSCFRQADIMPDTRPPSC